MKYTQIVDLIKSLPTSKPIFNLSLDYGDVRFTLKESVDIDSLIEGDKASFKNLLIKHSDEVFNKDSLRYSISISRSLKKVLKEKVKDTIILFVKRSFSEGLLVGKNIKRVEDTKLYKFYQVKMFAPLEDQDSICERALRDDRFFDLINVYDYMIKNVSLYESSQFVKKDVHVMNTMALLNIIMDRIEPNFNPDLIRFKRRKRRR